MAAAMVAAALWLYDNGKWQGAKTTMQREFQGHLRNIVGN